LCHFLDIYGAIDLGTGALNQDNTIWIYVNQSALADGHKLVLVDL